MLLTMQVTLFLELAEVYRCDGQAQEATRIMQEAMAEFQGGPEEIRLAVANADLALDRGEIDSALEILRTIGPEQSFFIQVNKN